MFKRKGGGGGQKAFWKILKKTALSYTMASLSRYFCDIDVGDDDSDDLLILILTFTTTSTTRSGLTELQNKFPALLSKVWTS